MIVTRLVKIRDVLIKISVKESAPGADPGNSERGGHMTISRRCAVHAETEISLANLQILSLFGNVCITNQVTPSSHSLSPAQWV